MSHVRRLVQGVSSDRTDALISDSVSSESALTSGAAASNGPLDLALLSEVFDSDEAALIDFVLDALRELETSLFGFSKAIVAKDVTTSLALAHALKGAAANIGAGNLAATMFEAERAAESHDWTAVRRAHARGSTALRDAVLWAHMRKKGL